MNRAQPQEHADDLESAVDMAIESLRRRPARRLPLRDARKDDVFVGRSTNDNRCVADLVRIEWQWF